MVNRSFHSINSISDHNQRKGERKKLPGFVPYPQDNLGGCGPVSVLFGLGVAIGATVSVARTLVLIPELGQRVGEKRR